MLKKDWLHRLTQYLAQRDDIVFAFLFGSQAHGIATHRSDVDIAVYFSPKVRYPIEFEMDCVYENEHTLWSDMEDIIGTDADMIVLNRVSATIAAAALRGQPLIIKNVGVYLDFMSAVTDEADSFMDYIITDYREKYAL
jgi:hypothetical protein